MYAMFTNICPKNQPNVGKYTIHGAYGFWSIQQFWTNPGPHHIADQIFPVSDKIPSKAIQISYISVDYLYPSTNPIIFLFLINNVLYQLYHHLNFSSKEFM